MNEGIHLDLDTWIVPGQIHKANLCRGLGNRYIPAGTEVLISAVAHNTPGWRHACRLCGIIITIIVISVLLLAVMIKERRLRWLGHAARRSNNNMAKQLILLQGYPDMYPVGRPCDTWKYYVMKNVKDIAAKN